MNNDELRDKIEAGDELGYLILHGIPVREIEDPVIRKHWLAASNAMQEIVDLLELD